ncbi:hypothetical protein ROE7235_03908 [Roseibaca ekhonensis]|uniref:Secreted protein n=1 Tax=Roseinatronobacter ekhonensis TaxID=254356 RepID=A0A3B0N271_9RHOB|nr:hypothetical protein ROE7235_03908 [Roseibaca ekhonensis]
MPGMAVMVWLVFSPATARASIPCAASSAEYRVSAPKASACASSAACSSTVALDLAATLSIWASNSMAGRIAVYNAKPTPAVARADPRSAAVFCCATSRMAVPCAICAAPNRSTRSAAPWIFCMAARAGAVA